MKQHLACLLVITQIFILSACMISPKKTLSDSKIQSIAIQMNEELNFHGKMSEKYNLQYSNFHYETDGFNRYIAVLHYQYEDAQRNYQSGDVIVYFSYLPESDTCKYEKTNIAFPGLAFDEEKWIDHIKQSEDFAWGTDSAQQVASSKPATDIQDSENDTIPSPAVSQNDSSSNIPINFEGQYFNEYINFQICNNASASQSPSYSIIYMEEQKIVVNGFIENSQFEMMSSDYSISNDNNVSYTITFTISGYSSDHNGTIALAYTPTAGNDYEYLVCINIPAKIMCNDTYIPISKLSNERTESPIIPFSSNILGKSASSVLQEYSYMGIGSLQWQHLTNGAFSMDYYLTPDGTEKSYYLSDIFRIITERNGVVIGTYTDVSHYGYANVYQLLTALNAQTVLDYTPEITLVEDGAGVFPYLKWRIENGYMVIKCKYQNGTDWKAYPPATVCLYQN